MYRWKNRWISACIRLQFSVFLAVFTVLHSSLNCSPWQPKPSTESRAAFKLPRRTSRLHTAATALTLNPPSTVQHTHTPNTVIFPCNLAALVQIKISVCFWSVTFSRLRRVYVDLHKNLSAIFKQKLQLSIKLELHILTSSVSVSHYQLPNIPNTSVFGLSLLASSQRETEREV